MGPPLSALPATHVRRPRLRRHHRPAPLRRLPLSALLQRGVQPRALAAAQGGVPAPAGGAGGCGWGGCAAVRRCRML